ncbi:MAG: molybdate ABC transporter substrate-binding protein [Planctomycetota bacterium]|nr:MAG: molybdate ABC transporter substrate-binding protein [Planctomycetota bacterium]
MQVKPGSAVSWHLLCAWALAACGRDRPAAAGAAVDLTVAAASSLRELLEQTAAAYQAAHPGTTLGFSFDASSALARQIESGAAFDAFLSADAENVERVRGSLQAGSIQPFLSNTLVMVARSGLADAVTSPGQLKGVKGKIALAAPAVPAGRYARAYLTKAQLLAELEPRFVNADNVRAALALVESGAADYAFVYATDARVARDARQVWQAPPEDDPGIVYVAAAVRGRHAEAAGKYVAWLNSPAFQQAAAALGFLPPRS